MISYALLFKIGGANPFRLDAVLLFSPKSSSILNLDSNVGHLRFLVPPQFIKRSCFLNLTPLIPSVRVDLYPIPKTFVCLSCVGIFLPFLDTKKLTGAKDLELLGFKMVNLTLNTSTPLLMVGATKILSLESVPMVLGSKVIITWVISSQVILVFSLVLLDLPASFMIGNICSALG